MDKAFWLEVLESLDGRVAIFIDRFPEAKATDFQFKWNLMGSVLSRSIRGRLRHLPSGQSTEFRFKLPV